MGKNHASQYANFGSLRSKVTEWTAKAQQQKGIKFQYPQKKEFILLKAYANPPSSASSGYDSKANKQAPAESFLPAYGHTYL